MKGSACIARLSVFSDELSGLAASVKVVVMVGVPPRNVVVDAA